MTDYVTQNQLVGEFSLKPFPGNYKHLMIEWIIIILSCFFLL